MGEGRGGVYVGLDGVSVQALKCTLVLVLVALFTAVTISIVGNAV